MWNEVVLIGNVGRDPDIRHTQNGSKVASFSLATTETWKKDGERQERTDWHNVVAWGNLADIIEEYVEKGSKIAVRGKLRTRKWTDQSGNDRYTTEVVLDGYDAKLTLLGGKGNSGEQRSRPSGGRSSSSAKPSKSDGRSRQPETVDETNFDDDIPF